MNGKRARYLRHMARDLKENSPASLPKKLRKGNGLYITLKKIWYRFKEIPEGVFHESF